MPRLAIAMFMHEGNSFSPLITGLDQFRAAAWAKGAEAAGAWRGTPSEIGGAIDFLDARPGWDACYLRLAHATPAGPIAAELFDATCHEIVAGLAGQGFDVVYLALHGAMMVDGRDLADLSLIERVRAAIGPDALLGVSFDLHANLHPATVDHVDFASGYRTHPHVDQRETALRVLTMLERTLAGEVRPVGHIAKADTILPSINMRTDTGPMAELEAQAVAMTHGAILDAVPFGGFSYADTVAAGAAAMVFADSDRDLARRGAEALRDAIEARRDAFFQSLPDADAAVADALAAIGAGQGPVALVDAADNPLSGGILDTPGLLDALMRANPSVSSLMLLFCDPDMVDRAEAAGVGGEVSGAIGGRLSPRYGAPLPIRATVAALAPGRFAARPPLLCGPWMDFGRLALLDVAGTAIRLVVSSVSASPHDPGLPEALGIDTAGIDLFCVKAKNHFRAAYEGRFGTIIACDAPGPAALDIAGFAFVRAPRHLHPLTGRTG